MSFRYKQYSSNVPIHKLYSKSFVSDILNKQQTEKMELDHSLRYNLSINQYRKYRRGENRCSLCGIKLVESIKRLAEETK